MAQSIQADENESLDVIESQIRECYGRVVYTHKSHEKAADQTLNFFSRLQFGQIGLSAISTTGFLAILFGKPEDSHAAAIAAGIVSLLLLGLNSYMQGKDLGQLSEKHKSVAAKLWDIRESYISLLSDIASRSITLGECKQKRDELQSRLAEVYETAPRTSADAYNKASEGLKNKEELTFSDDEIDKLLPQSLRRSERAKIRN